MLLILYKCCDRVQNINSILKQTILFDAPLAGYDEHFNTMALKVQIKIIFYMITIYLVFCYQMPPPPFGNALYKELFLFY